MEAFTITDGDYIGSKVIQLIDCMAFNDYLLFNRC